MSTPRSYVAFPANPTGRLFSWRDVAVNTANTPLTENGERLGMPMVLETPQRYYGMDKDAEGGDGAALQVLTCASVQEGVNRPSSQGGSGARRLVPSLRLDMLPTVLEPESPPERSVGFYL